MVSRQRFSIDDRDSDAGGGRGGAPGWASLPAWLMVSATYHLPESHLKPQMSFNSWPWVEMSCRT